MEFYPVVILVIAVGVAQPYAIDPQFEDVGEEYFIPIGNMAGVVETDLLREKRSPQGSIDFNAAMGPGRTGNAGLGYNHQVWKGRGGESLELGGNYMGQFGNGKPQHNFGIGGTFRF